MQRITSIRLIAPESPKRAFYALSLMKGTEGYHVAKESGYGASVLDRRVWLFSDEILAFRFYTAKLKEKLNPNRTSPRKYVIAN